MMQRFSRFYFAVLSLSLAFSGYAQVTVNPDDLTPTPPPQQPTQPFPQNPPLQFNTPMGSTGTQPSLSELIGEAYLMPHESIRPQPPLWPYYLAASALGLLLFGLLGWWLYRRSRKPKPVAIIPADIRALDELSSLKPLVDQAEARQFSFKASEIIRSYIQERFGVSAINRTTREFLNQSLDHSQPVLNKHSDKLEQFLKYCDMAKFAKQAMTSKELNAMYDTAARFITETRPSILADPNATENRKHA